MEKGMKSLENFLDLLASKQILEIYRKFGFGKVVKVVETLNNADRSTRKQLEEIVDDKTNSFIIENAIRRGLITAKEIFEEKDFTNSKNNICEMIKFLDMLKEQLNELLELI